MPIWINSLKSILKRRTTVFLFKAAGILIKKPEAVISFSSGIGDDLLCTIVIAQLKKKGVKNIWIKTLYPELYKNNPFVDRIIKKKDPANAKNRNIDLFLKYNHIRTLYPYYTFRNNETDRDEIPAKHIIHIMCEKAGVYPPEELKPLFFLSEKEKTEGRLYNNQICIQSTGIGSLNYMKNKDWFPERLEKVVLELNKKYTVIQLGSKEDKLIEGVIDLRGKTSIRETAAILYASHFFIGLVGFLMHLARAVDCSSIIIYGGREHPDQTGYSNNINIFSELECSPCWYWNRCDFDRQCMKLITAEHILNAVSRIENDETQVSFPTFSND